MNQQESLTNVSKYLARFSEEVSISNANGDFSINKHAENVLIDILNILFDCDLRNMNETSSNYPAIDLADEKKRICFQITSDPKLSKVKSTISKFVKYEQFKSYDQLYMFIITNKLSKYSDESIQDHISKEYYLISANVGTQLIFSPKKHILERSDIYRLLEAKNDLNEIRKVEKLLKDNFKDFPDKWKLYEQTKLEYDSSLLEEHEYLNIKGFSPKINNQIIKISFDNVYINLSLKSSLGSEYHQEIDNLKEGDFIFNILSSYNNKIVVLGDPGSGKSTLLKHITRSVVSNRNTNSFYADIVPVFIRISNYSNFLERTGKGLDEYIIDYFDKKYEKVFVDAISENKLLFLLDGLDEITKVGLRQDVIDQFNRLSSQYPECYFIVSSRKVGYDQANLGAKFTHLEIEGLQEEQIKEFAINWYHAIANHTDKDFKIAEESGIELFTSIRGNNSVLKLASSPLLLTIIALIHYKGIRIPNKRVELYDISVSTLLENWVLLRKSHRQIQLDQSDLEELLAPIAFKMHEEYSDGLIKESEFKELFIENYRTINGISNREAKKECKEIIEFLREDSGFFYEKGYDSESGEAMFGFIHLSFEEFFAAKELIQRWKEGSFNFDKYVFKSRWFEVIRLAASLLKYNDGGRVGRVLGEKFISEILFIEDPAKEFNRLLMLVLSFLEDDIDISVEKFNNLITKTFSEIKNYPIYPLELDSFLEMLGDHLTRMLEKVLLNSIKWKHRLFNSVVDFFLSEQDWKLSAKYLTILQSIGQNNVLFMDLENIFFKENKFKEIDRKVLFGLFEGYNPISFYNTERYKEYALKEVEKSLIETNNVSKEVYYIFRRAYISFVCVDFTNYVEKDFVRLINEIDSPRVKEFIIRFSIIELFDDYDYDELLLHLNFLDKEFESLNIDLNGYYEYIKLNKNIDYVFSLNNITYNHNFHSSIIKKQSKYYLIESLFFDLSIQEVELNVETLKKTDFSDDYIKVVLNLENENNILDDNIESILNNYHELSRYFYDHEEEDEYVFNKIFESIDREQNYNNYIFQSLSYYLFDEFSHSYNNNKYFKRVLSSKYLNDIQKFYLLYNLSDGDIIRIVGENTANTISLLINSIDIYNQEKDSAQKYYQFQFLSKFYLTNDY